MYTCRYMCVYMEIWTEPKFGPPLLFCKLVTGKFGPSHFSQMVILAEVSHTLNLADNPKPFHNFAQKEFAI